MTDYADVLNIAVYLFVMAEPKDKDALMDGIKDALEGHGYLPRMRAGIKVVTLKKAQSLVSSGAFPETPEIARKKLDGDDAKIASLCLDLFRFCHLDHAAEMLRTEAEFQEVDVAGEYGASGDSPVLCSLIAGH